MGDLWFLGFGLLAEEKVFDGGDGRFVGLVGFLFGVVVGAIVIILGATNGSVGYGAARDKGDTCPGYQGYVSGVERIIGNEQLFT